MSVAMVGVGVAAVGTIAQMDAAGDAADAQAGSAREANMVQMMAQQQMRDDLKPWTDSGRGANSLLNRYLGIGGAGSGGLTSMGLQTGLSPDEVRQRLLSRYTTTGMPANAPKFNAETLPLVERMRYEQIKNDPNQRAAFEAAHLGDPKSVRDLSGANDGIHGDTYAWDSNFSPVSTVDEEGLNAAIKQYYEEQDALNRAAEADPTYGSLLRAYRNGAEFDSGPAFSFTGKDLASEPGYQFGLQQGTQGIERGQAARGNFLSGAAMKELTRFNEDYAGTKFNDAFNRSSATYGTNLNRRMNEWNTNLNAYNQNRNSIYNFLTGVSNTGQASAARVGANNQQVANSIGNNLMSVGNTQAAASVASGNALTNGINQAANSLNGAGGWNNLLSSFNIGRSGNNYNGSSTNYSAPNYTNTMDMGVTW